MSDSITYVIGKPAPGYRPGSTERNSAISAIASRWVKGYRISEMRIHYGPGYRLYFTKKSNVLVILLAGGDKSSQRKDIAEAIRLARQL